jgi:hypothetical protein
VKVNKVASVDDMTDSSRLPDVPSPLLVFRHGHSLSVFFKGVLMRGWDSSLCATRFLVGYSLSVGKTFNEVVLVWGKSLVNLVLVRD